MNIPRIQIPEDVKRKCYDYLKTHDLGQRGSFDGNKEEQFTGLVGEVMFKFHLTKQIHLPDSFGFDGGYDMIYQDKKIDVKTMGRNVLVRPSFVNNFVASQLGYEAEIIVFCSINKKVSIFEICGYLPKSLFEKKAELYQAGTKRTRDDGTTFECAADMYEVNMHDLIDINFLN